MIANMTTIQMIGATAAGVILGAIVGFWVLKRVAKREVDSAKKYKEKTINEAHRKAKTIKKEALLRAKDSLYQMKLDFEKETKEKKEQLLALEKRLFHKEENLDKKIEQYEQKEKVIAKREKDITGIEEGLAKKQVEYEELIVNQRRQLERVAGLSSREAKEVLIKSMESEAKHDSARLIRRIENEAKESPGPSV